MRRAYIVITLKPAFEAQLQLARWLSYGGNRFGNRRFVAVQGGTIRGSRINGVVIPGGGDWPLVDESGILRFDARWSFKTSDGALVYVHNVGVRRASEQAHERLDRNEMVDAKEVYFRTTPTFETGAPKYEWLVSSVFVATGRRVPDGLELEVYEVL